MKTMLKLGIVVILLLAGYLTLWPIPIAPQAWQAPADNGYTGDFAANTRLANLDRIPLLEGVHGPEDFVVVQEDGREIVYATSQTGVILRIDTERRTSSVFANTGGVPLGMERDAAGNFIVADAFRGLLSISADGRAVEVLTDEVNGSPILYADDLDIAPDGVIYFSDASTKFGAQAAGSTLAASLLEIIEHGKTGRFLSYDPATGETAIVATGYSFANGVAMCPDGDCFLGAETGSYSIDRIYVAGPKKGQSERFIENLPGFPDNINRGSEVDGKQTYWVGLAAPRAKVLDDAAQSPFARKMMQRIPQAWQPAAVPYGHVFQIDENGKVLQSLQDPQGGYPTTTGAVESDEWLYVSSLETHDLGRLRKSSAPAGNSK